MVIHGGGGDVEIEITPEEITPLSLLTKAGNRRY
jgi:hypothetical protein